MKLKPKNVQDAGAPHSLISSLVIGIPFLCVLVLKAMTSDFGNVVPAIIFAGFLIHGLALCFYWRRLPKGKIKRIAGHSYLASYWIFMLGLLFMEVLLAWNTSIDTAYIFNIAGVITLAINGLLVAFAWSRVNDSQTSLQAWSINLGGAFLVAGMLLVGPPLRDDHNLTLSAKDVNQAPEKSKPSRAHKTERKLTETATDIIARTQQLFLSANNEEEKPEDKPQHWSYSGHGGPEHWAELNPDFAQCHSGQEQSPVDIPRNLKSHGKVVELDYRPSALGITDMGHTIQANFDRGSHAYINGQKYELRQMHYHSPSEHTINGAAYAAEWHFVHADKNGKLAVIAVMVEKGKRQPMLDMVLNYLPEEKGVPSKPKGMTLLASDLFPKKIRVWQYRGSLTTPPCSENVLWSVLTEPMQMSGDQLEKLQERYFNNNRPVRTERSLGKPTMAH